jgi:RND superfamily putative drug exporter
MRPPPGLTLHVAGLSAGTRDFLSALYGRFPWVILFVVCVTYVVLLVLLRSVWLPLKAVIVNSLSIMASFGALVVIFQQGHLSSVLGFVPEGFVDATLPVIMFCTLFGVSMDYEVFLLTRMREAWLETHDNVQAVGFGLERTGSIITSAALIIVIVAGSFATTSILITKAIGVGLAVAIALDATIIRVLLVPATMRLVGSINWWLPSFLDRALPKIGEE